MPLEINTDRLKTDSCVFCHASAGLHHYETMQCPKNGREETREGHRQVWVETRFKDSGIRDLQAGAARLASALDGAVAHILALPRPPKGSELEKAELVAMDFARAAMEDSGVHLLCPTYKHIEKIRTEEVSREFDFE